jgi:phosphate/sulfate permease
MAWAFRAAFRPVHVRQDFESVPWIAVHTKALWVPVLITLASTVLVAVTGGTDMLSAFLYQYFILTPAIGGVFIAGFLAPRASWLLGVIVGLVAAACYSILGLSGVVPIGPTVNSVDVVVTSFVLSPLVGAFFAAAAAWYRRFLALSNPNRRRQPAKGPVPKKGDGRTRSGGTSQKAGVRR